MLVTMALAVSRTHLEGVHGLEVARLARIVASPRGLLALLGALAIQLVLNVCMDRGCMASAHMCCNSKEQFHVKRSCLVEAFLACTSLDSDCTSKQNVADCRRLGQQ
jgi:hypothetical protein